MSITEAAVLTTLEITNSDLTKALKLVIGIVENSQILPILSHVRVQFAGNTLTLMTTDSELQLKTKLNLQAEEGLEIDMAVPARKFFDICRSLPAQARLQLKFSDNTVVISTQDNQFRLSCLPSSQFPSAPFLDLDVAITIAQDDLRDILGRSCFAMATKDIRYYLNGVLFESHPDKLQAVATNGHRLAVQKVQATVAASVNIIVPRKAVLELAKLLESDHDKEVKLYVNDKMMRVQADSFELSTSLLGGDYPNYNAIIPNASDVPMLVASSDLKPALQRAAILSFDQSALVFFNLTKNQLNLTVENANEEAKVGLPVEYSGPNLKVGFNVNYILDIINAVGDKQLKFGFSDSKGGVLVQVLEFEHQGSYVVMPITV